MSLHSISLSDRFANESGAVVANGSQALLIAMMRQRRLDRTRGLDTAGFLSGYRGSPISALDTEAARSRKHLEGEDIRFEPGINEDLALTSVWGTQQVRLDPNANVDGVFAMWYGKGAGLDRSTDALRHAHGAGSSRLGGALIVCGDDHALKSSSQAFHSEPTFIDMQMPVLAPADMQDMIDFATLGWEMSRFSGCYVGLKVLGEHVNSTAVLNIGIENAIPVLPYELSEENDRWARWPDPWPDIERRILDVKLPAALDFGRANDLNRVVARAERPSVGVIVSGKSYVDYLQALSRIGLTPDSARELGLSLYKIGMPWPVDEGGLRDFARGHDAILVIEEKRDLIEAQLRAALYGQPGKCPKVILGGKDREGRPLFSRAGELSARDILCALAPEIAGAVSAEVQARLEKATRKSTPAPVLPMKPRSPYFCSGCPHNSSTKLPEGSRGMAGVGCHFMAAGMGRNVELHPQMGGEGLQWVGMSTFTDTDHMFVNLGDGTYFHSGSLAIRAALAAGTNVTYKILFNDVIAMTGGQEVEGDLSPSIVARQLRAEGVKRVEIVTAEPDAFHGVALPDGIKVHPRADLEQVQISLRNEPGVSALIYDQVCATEKRRRRKRRLMAEAPRKIIINEAVCEGCGDCSVQSNCLSVVPLETPMGRKRMIDQSHCNQDYSCVDGFCPSFVGVEGAGLRKEPLARQQAQEPLPEPVLPALADESSFDIVIAGVGGTGIVTVGALLGMAAYLDGRVFTIHDKLGMAQKYGAVSSHLRIAKSQDQLDAVRIGESAAKVLVSGDLRVANEASVLSRLDDRAAELVVAAEQAISGEFIHDGSHDFQVGLLKKNLKAFSRKKAHLLPAKAMARTYLGDEIGANLILVGLAWQKGLIPIGLEAIERAVEMNGIAIELNKAAFDLGRRYAVDPKGLEGGIQGRRATSLEEMHLEQILDHRGALLTDYQDAGYAKQYRAVVETIIDAESRATGQAGALSRAAAINLARLMAYKDEYEVARLHTAPAFRQKLDATFVHDGKLSFYLAPPILARKDKVTGLPVKRRFGGWIMPVFRGLARLKALRGTMFDPFGYHAERRQERRWIQLYLSDLKQVADNLTSENHALFLSLAQVPDRIRGYGHVKVRAMQTAAAERKEIHSKIRTPQRRHKDSTAA